MKIEIQLDSYNKLLKRRDLILRAEHDGVTPSRREMLKKLSEFLNVPEDRIAIVRMVNVFGQHKVSIHCHVYDTPEDMKKYERKYVLKRMEAAIVGKTS